MKINKYISLVLISVCSFLLTSCWSEYNSSIVVDKNEGKDFVYGEVGGPALQAKNQSYPSPTPETMDKARKFRALIESELASAKK